MERVLGKYVWGVMGGVVALFEPLRPLVYVCILFVLCDCFAAYRLSVRIKKKSGKSKGKFQSRPAKKIFNTIIEMIIMLALANLLDTIILKSSRYGLFG